VSKFLRKAFSNSIWTSLGSIVNAVLSLFLAGLTIRWLGLDEAGFVLFFQAIVGANRSVFSLGLSGGALRYVSEAYAQEERTRLRRLIDTVVSFNLGAMLLLILILWQLIGWFLDLTSYAGDYDAALTYGHLALFALLFTSLTGSFVSCLEGAQHFRFVSIFQIGMRFLLNTAKVLILSMSPSLYALGLIEVLAALIGVLVVGGQMMRVFRFRPRLVPNREIFSELWRFSRWSYLQSLSHMVVGNLDRVVVGAFFTAQAVPYYSMAKRGYLIGHEVLAGFAKFFFPMLSSQGDDKEAIIERIEPRVRWILTGLGMTLYGGMILVGPTLVNWLVRPGFGTEIAPLILIFGCVGMISIQTIMPYHISMATDRPWLTTLCQYCNTVSTLLLTIVAAWGGSLQGVAAAHFCDVISVLLFYYIIDRRNRRFRRLAHVVLSPISTNLLSWGVILTVWMFLFVRGASWYIWMGAAVMVLPVGALLSLFLERKSGDRYRNLATVRSIQGLAAERFSFLGSIRVPFLTSRGADPFEAK
jgi:O-antigen/teichoic acid export membrane protein